MGFGEAVPSEPRSAGERRRQILYGGFELTRRDEDSFIGRLRIPRIALEQNLAADAA